MLLSVKDLSVSFDTLSGTIEPVRNLSFVIKEGSTLGIVGESGCGKSLTSLALMNLLPANAKVKAKEISFNSHDLLSCSKMDFRKIRGREMAMIFQDPMTSLNPSSKK